MTHRPERPGPTSNTGGNSRIWVRKSFKVRRVELEGLSIIRLEGPTTILFSSRRLG